MSDWRAPLDENPFGAGDASVFEAATPAPMYRAKARTGRRRKARPERPWSYGRVESVISIAERRVPYPTLGGEPEERLPDLILLSIGWVDDLPR